MSLFNLRSGIFKNTGTAYLKNKPSLDQSILKKSVNTPSSILEELTTLVNTYSLNWIPDSTGNGSYFISSQVTSAINSSESKFIQEWKLHKPQVLEYFLEFGVMPRLICIKGAELSVFKKLWQHYNSSILKTSTEVWIMDWSIAYWYLNKYKNSSINNNKTKYNWISPNPLAAKSEDKYCYTDSSEESLKLRIMELLSYQSTIKYTQEVSVTNIFKSSTNVAKTRRFDWVIHSTYKGNRYKKAYELKIGEITADIVKEVLAEKRYVDLLRYRYNKRKCKLILTSPIGISPEAKALIRNNPYVDFVPLQDFIDKIIHNILKECAPESKWYFIKEVFPRLFPENTLSVSISEKKVKLLSN